MIDHRPANLVAQAMILRSFGYTVLEAGSYREAFRACHEHAEPIHLIIIAATVAPSRAGDIAGRLQLLRPETSVLFLSGFSNDGAAVEEWRRVTSDGLSRSNLLHARLGAAVMLKMELLHSV